MMEECLAGTEKGIVCSSSVLIISSRRCQLMNGLRAFAEEDARTT